jgi:hypothetical protein
VRTINLKSAFPSVEEARRRLITEMETARRSGVRLLKIIHGWGSTGEGGKLAPAIRKSLRLRVREGRAAMVIPGERFSGDTLEGRDLLRRHPSVHGDSDWNRTNQGISIVELLP